MEQMGSVGFVAGRKVTVDHELCNGAGLCAESAPDTFEVRDDAKSWVREGGSADLDAVAAARDLCPWAAIAVAEEAGANA